MQQDRDRWNVWWRDLLLVKSDCGEYIVNIDREEEIRMYADKFAASAIGNAIKSIQETMQQLDKNANARLALEVLMLNIPVSKLEESYA